MTATRPDDVHVFLDAIPEMIGTTNETVYVSPDLCRQLADYIRQLEAAQAVGLGRDALEAAHAYLDEIQPLELFSEPVVIASGRYYGDDRGHIQSVAEVAFANYLGINVEEFDASYRVTVTDARPRYVDPLVVPPGLPWFATVTCYEKEES